MAKAQKPAENAAPIYKKGEITFDVDGQKVSFNDAWARKLKPGKYAPDGKEGPDLEPKQLFVKEFEGLDQLAALDPAERTALLEKAYDACMAAQ